jgi:hypothetical protein
VQVFAPVALSLAIALGALAACSSFGEATGVSPATDGGLDAPATGTDATAADGAAPGTCTSLIADDFTTQRMEWKQTGDHQAFEKHRLVLTPGTVSRDGAVWWMTPLTFTGYLRVRVDFHIETPAGMPKGNGFALTWADAMEPLPTTIGGLGASFGVCASTPPVHGYAVAGSTANDTIAIVETVNCDTDTPGARPAAVLDGDHFFAFEVRPTSITGTLDGMVPLTRTNLSPPAVTTGHFGMSAGAAAGASTAHVITKVSIESCVE